MATTHTTVRLRKSEADRIWQAVLAAAAQGVDQIQIARTYEVLLDVAGDLAERTDEEPRQDVSS